MSGAHGPGGTLRERMRVPLRVSVLLLGLLGLNMLLAAWHPFADVWIVEVAVAAIMVVNVLVFSMEIRHQSPLIRLYSALGFFWVAILFTFSMIDYLTR